MGLEQKTHRTNMSDNLIPAIRDRSWIREVFAKLYKEDYVEKILPGLCDPRVQAAIQACPDPRPAHRDGSGCVAVDYLHEVHVIALRLAVLDANLSFITSHAAALTGLAWSVEYLDKGIKINPWRMPAKDIAKRWPAALWKRKEPDNQHKERPSLNWEATVDGITLTIVEAETFSPVPDLPKGDAPLGE